MTLKTLDLGFTFQITPAMQNAVCALDGRSLPRYPGGYGDGRRNFVPLKTAIRFSTGPHLIEITGKGKKSEVALTELGRDVLAALKAEA